MSRSASPGTPKTRPGLYTGEAATKHRRYAILSGFLALTLVLISCDLSTLTGPAPIATPIPGLVNTIVVQTAQAAASQTEALAPPTATPSFTPVPTKTPSVTPSPTATFLFLLATRTRTPKPAPTSEVGSGNYDCSLSDQTPADGSKMTPNQSFVVSWTVQNTGTATWDSNAIDFVYVNGAKLTSAKTADLPETVASGDSVTLKLTMTAPNSTGNYKTAWSLEKGKNDFCRVTISIIVK